MFSEAQKAVDDWVQNFKKPYWQPLSQLARVSEEVGELARLLNHQFGDKPKKETELQQELGEEIAGVLFALICLANSQNVSLDEAFANVMEKAHSRDSDRYEKK